MLARLSATEAHPEQPPEQTGEISSGEAGGPENTTGMALESGAAGAPDASREAGGMRIKDRNAEAQISREQAVKEAREAGILGSALLRETMSSLVSTADLTSGFDDIDRRGALGGADGVGAGTFGMGVSGVGVGGGCLAPPCGIVGTGTRFLGPIGGRVAGDGYNLGGGHGTLRTHVALPPVYSTPTISNEGVDRAMIKRAIKQREAQISYCYEKELLARPGIGGEIKISFLIAPTGNVQSSTGTGFDPAVASCVAAVVQGISFPAVKNGTNVAVNYPFIFRTAGQR
jgi:hypothetical protein